MMMTAGCTLLRPWGDILCHIIVIPLLALMLVVLVK